MGEGGGLRDGELNGGSFSAVFADCFHSTLLVCCLRSCEARLFLQFASSLKKIFCVFILPSFHHLTGPNSQFCGNGFFCYRKHIGFIESSTGFRARARKTIDPRQLMLNDLEQDNAERIADETAIDVCAEAFESDDEFGPIYFPFEDFDSDVLLMLIAGIEPLEPTELSMDRHHENMFYLQKYLKIWAQVGQVLEVGSDIVEDERLHLFYVLEKHCSDADLILANLTGKDELTVRTLQGVAADCGVTLFLANIEKEVSGGTYSGPTIINDVITEEYGTTRIADLDGTVVATNWEITEYSDWFLEKPFWDERPTKVHWVPGDDMTTHYYKATVSSQALQESIY
ncbi:hypothetical protein K402DRAFT_7464 [Aulographum hederae CBS 113979]|uniref:Uncharacterized protein n=1 Tax=Aulographum hederae CBS 113979 TaxID=1176131 RepID=A0A6G1HHI3_9PEZI|nr:hypothetical protein K402DRAFT_7464 [Aulographum hederae CBS 113979]